MFVVFRILDLILIVFMYTTVFFGMPSLAHDGHYSGNHFHPLGVEENKQFYEWHRFVPFAVYADGSTEAALEVKMTDRVQSVSVVGTPIRGSAFVEGEALDQIQLFDDGTHGDRVAGDLIFTRSSISAEIDPFFYNNTLDMAEFYDPAGNDLFVETVDGQTHILNLSIHEEFKLGVVSPSIEVTNITSLESGMQVSDSMVAMVWEGPLWIDLFNGLLRQEIATRFYSQFQDEFDYLLLWPDRPSQYFGSVDKLGAPSGLATNVQNKIDGIGIPLFDSTSLFGLEFADDASNRLQCIVTFNFSITGPFLHELGHNWGIRLGEELGVPGPHWGVASTHGLLGGFKRDTFQELGENTYGMEPFGSNANGGVKYGNLELYLMGMIPAEEVEPYIVLEQPKFLEYNDDGLITYSAQGVTEYTLEDIISVHGERTPSFEESQKTFSIANIVISDRELTPVEFAYYEARFQYQQSLESDGFLETFHTATHGVGVLESNVRDNMKTQLKHWELY